jgi:hypothetical protein
MKRTLLTVLCVGLISLCGSNTSRASGVGAIGDVVVVRPASFVATLVGSVFFVVALPFTVPSQSVRKSADILVVAPAKYTFTRPIDDFDIDEESSRD